MIRLIVFIGIVYWVASSQSQGEAPQKAKPKFIAEELENDSTLQHDMYEALRDGFNIDTKNLEIF